MNCVVKTALQLHTILLWDLAMKKMDIVFMIVDLDGLEKNVQKSAANIVKTLNAIETMVHASMVA